MTQEELDESIQWEAEQYIPFDVKDVNIDTQILTPEGDAAGQMDVLLVAAKKDMINDYTSVCAEAGLTATVVDVDAFAVQNATKSNYEVDAQTVVLINVGAAVSNINVISRGVDDLHPRHHDGRQRLHRGDPEAAQHLLRRGGGLKVGGQGESDAVVPQEVERVIQGVAEQMGGEIQRSSTSSRPPAPTAHRASLPFGGTARIAALFKVLEARAGVRVEI